ncbi:MAG: DEAD/DEAH box helicase [Ignavibacteriaceae bacterium]|nr:DEAD/DEAH box helicase [Ignavibacteriaceae bacterium]
MNNYGFGSFGFSDVLLQAIKLKGFEEPTEIQRKVIPLILDTELDIIGQAQTGTGKTAAFALPIIEKLKEKAGRLQALVLVPTRELAIQVSEEFNSLRGSKNIHAAPIYGGQSYDTQFRHLKKGVDAIIGTPGRVLDHLNRKTFSIDNISFAVLDEADEMLNMGFIEDIENILSHTPKERRTLLFSATMPERIMALTKKYMGPREIVRTQKSGQTTDLTDQVYYEVKESDKIDALCRIIDTTNEFFGLIFCRTKNDVDFVSSKLADRDYDVEGLHGDINQTMREKILNKFRNKKVNVLIATDVAARGLDIEELTHVINYALPQDAESYLHRIGRTGRAGKEGTAITFITPEEHRKLMHIKKSTQTEIRKQRIPHVKEVISFKREKIISELKNMVEMNVPAEYMNIANNLLNDNEPKKIIAALIKNSYQNELEEKNYGEIRDLFEPQKQNKDLRQSGSLYDKQRNRKKFERRSDHFARKNKSDSESGKIRLFLALGKKDDLTPNTLLEMLKKKAKVPGNKVTGIHINDSYSFFNVTPGEADLIIEKLNSKDKKKRPLVERAKPTK